MIHKNTNYENIENVTVAEFGLGSISVCSSKGDGYFGLLMKSCDPNPIGEYGVKCDTSDEFKPDLSIVFRNKESFKVFYEMVQQVKGYFEELESNVLTDISDTTLYKGEGKIDVEIP